MKSLTLLRNHKLTTILTLVSFIVSFQGRVSLDCPFPCLRSNRGGGATVGAVQTDERRERSGDNSRVTFHGRNFLPRLRWLNRTRQSRDTFLSNYARVLFDFINVRCGIGTAGGTCFGDCRMLLRESNTTSALRFKRDRSKLSGLCCVRYYGGNTFARI